MKKNMKIFSLCAVVMILTVSCIEEAEMTGSLSETKRQELIQTDSDKIFDATVSGMYQDLQQYAVTDLSNNYFGQKSFDYLTSLMGNDMIMTGLFAMSIYHYMLDYWAENYAPTANRWSEYYRTITNANKILKSIDKDTKDPSQLYYRAVALGFRGYAYLQLTYLYQYSYYTGADGTKWEKGKVYDHSKEPCVPIITEDTEGDQPRSSVEAVYKRLLEDLEESYAIFDALGAVRTIPATDFDGCVAATYLARAYMVKHDWDNALKYAQVVIDNIPYLDSEDQILQGFSDISLKDVVFGCDITADNSTVYMSWFSQMDSYGDGYAGIGVWRAGFKPFVDRIADNDIRLKWFCCERSTGITDKDGKKITLLRDTEYQVPEEYLSVKFIGAGRNAIVSTGGDGTGWELGDYIYLRSEEAWFVKAEALAHKDDNVGAIKVLEEIMKTRQPDYSYTFVDKAALIEEINYQKRVEFWGEGIEYLDNRRLNIPVDRTDKTWGEANNNHYDGARLYADQEDRCFLYQLPISEIENSTKLTEADQN